MRVGCFAVLIPLLIATPAAASGVWQGSDSSALTLGIRDRDGTRTVPVTFVVDYAFATGGKLHLTLHRLVHANRWTNVSFPNDFDGPEPLAGDHGSWKGIVGGKGVVGGSFRAKDTPDGVVLVSEY